MLLHRGVHLDTTACPLCNEVLETSGHLMLHCSFTFKLWDYFLSSMCIPWTLPGTVLQLLAAWDNNVLTGKCKEIWKMLHFAIVWNVWNERNLRVFGGRPKDVEEVIDLVKQSLILWSCDSNTFQGVDSSQVIHNWEAVIHN
ncbi:uncharacterized protein LOC113360742 [Papaver somniferum]|uniref:uncharacterized protein LOC113360742 n=1 Tax=Papaver somniferum TaxID=3469 RepID=UPI000E6F7EB8|nr:uncharacterized protein LOC113360742 [Papaver somniferum]